MYANKRLVDPAAWLLALLFPTLLILGDVHAAAEIERGINEYADTSQSHLKSPDDPPGVVRVSSSTADHAEFKELQGPFSSGPEVTKACLGCHNEAGHQFMKGIHWTWEYRHPVTGQTLGKKHLVNNFCTNARGNEGMCAQCHAGYGWKDDSFDFSDQATSTVWSVMTPPAAITGPPTPRVMPPAPSCSRASSQLIGPR